MQRLGLDYESLSRINPRIIYCSITTYGQHGPKARRAAHDLNFQAETGMLALSADASGAPMVPPTLTGDLAGGTYPALFNIMLALRQRDLDGWAAGQWPRPGNELVTGGSVRYAIYKTSDGRFLSAAPLEDRFWETFLSLIGAPALLDEPDENVIRAEVTRIIASQPAAHWIQCFEGRDVCVSEVVNLEQAVQDPHFKERGIFEREVATRDGRILTALPVPVCAAFRSAQTRIAAPSLGEHTKDVLASTKTGGNTQ
jgi:crotonobetainyl-CoA:carnitine CoA-transferase CaiB-like acyl-CoA transferase